MHLLCLSSFLIELGLLSKIEDPLPLILCLTLRMFVCLMFLIITQIQPHFSRSFESTILSLHPLYLQLAGTGGRDIQRLYQLDLPTSHRTDEYLYTT